MEGEPFYAIVPLALVEITGDAGEAAFRGLGLHTERIRPAPGGVLGRIVCQLINESAFALGEGVGTAEDIDKGMMLGLSHPRGPFAWMEEIGADHVLRTLEAVGNEYREERYRPPGPRHKFVRCPRRSGYGRGGLRRHQAWGASNCDSATGSAHCASAKSPTGMPSGVGTSGVSRKYHSASSAAWQPEPAAVIA